MAKKHLLGKDIVSGKQGRVVATMPDGTVEDMFYVKNIEPTAAKNKNEFNVLGRVSSVNKSAGVTLTGSCTVYYVTSKFREHFIHYMKTGEDSYYDMVIENEDRTSATGKQTVSLTGVNFDEINIAKLDVETEGLEEDMSFTYEDADLLNKFNEL